MLGDFGVSDLPLLTRKLPRPKPGLKDPRHVIEERLGRKVNLAIGMWLSGTKLTEEANGEIAELLCRDVLGRKFGEECRWPISVQEPARALRGAYHNGGVVR